MPSFTVTEPHPTVATNSYVQYGRGGSGNYLKAPVTTDPAGVPTVASAPKKSSGSNSRYYLSGRGGAGNASLNRSPVSFEDEYAGASQAASPNAGCYVGRGGAGNYMGDNKKAHRKSDASSGSSTRSSGFMARLSGTFTR